MNAYSFKEKLVWVQYRFEMPLSGSICLDINDIDIESIINDINGNPDSNTNSLENNF